MSDPSALERHIAEVLDKVNTTWNKNLAAVLVADPTLAAILDLAAEYVDEIRSETPSWWNEPGDGVYATRRRDIVALLAAWRASRAEQEPTP